MHAPPRVILSLSNLQLVIARQKIHIESKTVPIWNRQPLTSAVLGHAKSIKLGLVAFRLDQADSVGQSYTYINCEIDECEVSDF